MGRALFLLPLALIGVLVLTVVTGHMLQVRPETGLSRLEHLAEFEKHLPDPNKTGYCTESGVASCPLAVCRDPKSCNLGKPNPSLMLMCHRPAGHWELAIYAISGTPPITYIAPTSQHYIQGVIRRDQCLQADWTVTMRLLGFVK